MKATTVTYLNLSGKRKLKDLYDDELITRSMCRNILSLVGEYFEIEALEDWTEEQLRHAANWAIRVYLRAGDNHTEQIRKPDFLVRTCPACDGPDTGPCDPRMQCDDCGHWYAAAENACPGCRRHPAS